MNKAAFIQTFKSIQPELKAMFERFNASPSAKRLFRSDYQRPYDPFDEKFQFQQGMSMNRAGEPGGVYWARSPQEANMLKSGSGAVNMPYPNENLLKLSPRDQAFYEAASRKAILDHVDKSLRVNQEGIAAPDARFLDFDWREWISKGYDKMPLKELTSKFKNETDFVSFPDLAVGNLALKNVVQVNPKKSVVKINDWGDSLYKILGAGGVAAGASAVAPTESDAFPLGKIIEKAGKLAFLPASRSAKFLIGKEVNGKVVTNVVQNPNNDAWRYLLFNDGSAQEVSKDMLASSVRNIGTKTYTDKLSTKSIQDRLDQAKKSLEYHRKRSQVLPARDTATKESHARLAERHRAIQMGNLKELGQAAEEYVTVQTANGSFTMPHKYAKLLEEEGSVKIIRSIGGKNE